jgi:spore coat polysaccharide biosynthesis protein SpsF
VRSSKPPISTAEFWAGAEGNAYTDRNRVEWQQRVPFWRHIQELTNAASFLEVGTNAGWNLRALRALNPEFSMSGIDLNEKALREAQAEGFDVEVMPGYKVAEFFGAGACDLAFTSGVLIHVGPDELVQTMAAIRDVSSQYVLAVEYDHPEIQEVEYRGHSGKLWKRPYGRLYEELGLSLVETGPAQGFNDCTYYLLEK